MAKEVVYKPIQKGVSTVSYEPIPTQQPYIPTEAEYSNKGEDDFIQVIISRADFTNTGGIAYPVPENYTFFLTNSLLSVSSDEAAATTADAKAYIKKNGIPEYLNVIQLHSTIGINYPNSYVSNMVYLMPIRINQGESIEYGMDSVDFHCTYSIMGYLKKNK